MFRTAPQVRGIKPGVEANAWTVIGVPFSRGKSSRRGGINWAVVVQCLCGKVAAVPVKSILHNKTQRCDSCSTAAKNFKHGGCGTSLYVCWRNIHSRCENAKSDDFHRYGARGIRVCSEWSEFTAFRDWAMANGYAHGLTIERKRNNDNYCPENCTWANRTVQARNRRSSRVVELDGAIMTVAELAELTTVKYGTIIYRLNHGLTVREAISE